MPITSESELRDLYGFPKDRPKRKVLDHLDKHALHFLSLAPFAVLSTVNAKGQVDASPKGGAPGFGLVNDGKLILPEAKGNNRLDGLVNMVETGRVGSIWFIPGVDETLRVNGSVEITQDPEFLGLFPNENHPPKTCIVITPEEVFLHCAKALMRSKLWKAEKQIERSSFPSIGEMLKDQLRSDGPAESTEDMVKRYQKDL